MKSYLGFCIAFLSILVTYAHPYAIGHKQQTFTDASRSKRSIAAEIYYPANTAGEDVSVASGIFPVLVFGHGFIMETGAYDVVWNAIVPKGYILVLPTTESSISPSHADFGKDLAFLVGALKTEGKNAASKFYNAVANTSAAMGHSMGGGAAFLAMAADTSITAFATFAAAVTNPSSVTAAKKIKKPALVFSASADCVAPAASHQTPMYDSLASSCKTYVSITGGSHCQFANTNTNCSLGELICFPKASISSSAQQATAFGLLLPWLNFYLKNDNSGASGFQDLIAGAKGITSKQNCNLQSNLGLLNIWSSALNIFPNPAKQTLAIEIKPNLIGANYIISDVCGKVVYANKFNSELTNLNIENLTNGIYFLRLVGENNINLKFVKN